MSQPLFNSVADLDVYGKYHPAFHQGKSYLEAFGLSPDTEDLILGVSFPYSSPHSYLTFQSILTSCSALAPPFVLARIFVVTDTLRIAMGMLDIITYRC